MNAVLSPIVSEFDSDEQAALYDQWFRAKVERSLTLADNPLTPRHAPDQVARHIHAVIEQASHGDGAPSHLA